MKKYRIDMLNRSSGSIDSHYTNNYSRMMKALMKEYGKLYNLKNGRSIYTLLYTDWTMRVYLIERGQNILIDFR